MPRAMKITTGSLGLGIFMHRQMQTQSLASSVIFVNEVPVVTNSVLFLEQVQLNRECSLREE